MIAVDAIFFDVDGTLVDARIDIANAVNCVLSAFKADPKPFGEIVSYIGTGVRDLVRKSLGTQDKDMMDKGVKIFSEYYIKHSSDESYLYPHVKETLEFFKNKRKFIITNRYRRFADVTLGALGIRRYFEDIFGGDDENCIKPSACMLDSVLPKLSIKKDRAIIVGDMDIDISTGKNLNIATCFVTYGLGKIEDIKDLRPDYIIDDIIKLKEIVI